MTDEKVLCYPRSVVEAAGIKPGFTACGYPSDELDNVDKATFLPRSEVEHDEAWVQAVAYSLIMQMDYNRVWPAPKYLCYRRTKAGSEGRLQGLCSVGIGGHANQADRNASRWGDLATVGPKAAARELEEELWRPWSRIECRAPRLLGFLYDDSTPVSRVHLGLVYRFEASVGEEFAPHDDDGTIEILGWVDRDGRLPDGTIPGEFEAWSRHVLEAR